MNYTHHELERISYITGNGQALLHDEASKVEDMEEAASDALGYIQEAKGSFPGEDFLQGLIDQCRAMSKGRVTKADVLAFCVELEELQDEIARTSEHGLDLLQKAEQELGG